MFEGNIFEEVNQATHCELEGKPGHGPCAGGQFTYTYLPNSRWPDAVRCISHGRMLMEGWVVKF